MGEYTAAEPINIGSLSFFGVHIMDEDSNGQRAFATLKMDLIDVLRLLIGISDKR